MITQHVSVPLRGSDLKAMLPKTGPVTLDVSVPLRGSDLKVNFLVGGGETLDEFPSPCGEVI